MTVGELMEELKKWPQDMPVACDMDIYYPPEECKVEITQRTWVHSNYPYDLPDFEYVNLE